MGFWTYKKWKYRRSFFVMDWDFIKMADDLSKKKVDL